MANLSGLPTTLKGGQEITFRHVAASDAETFLAFRHQIPHESINTMQYVGQTFPTLEETQKRLADGEADRVVLNIGAFHGQRIVGYLNFRMPKADHPWVQHIGQFGMMVLKDYWGLGIGKHLLKLQEAHAKSLGITRIEAHVRVKNERGVKLYEHNGYKIEGTRVRAARIDGEFHDEYYIAKMLDKVPWKPPTLETERLVLRAIDEDDAESIFDYAKNPNVSRFTLWEPHKTRTDSVSYIKDYVFKYYSEGIAEPFGVAFKENPRRLIGTVGCFWTSKQAKAMELAYAIEESQWGKGLVPEACKAATEYCFRAYDLKRIQARCKIENKASARVMQKIGMEYEGTLRAAIFHRERYWDMVYYAKLRDGDVPVMVGTNHPEDRKK